jgi:hypothetical protein
MVSKHCINSCTNSVMIKRRKKKNKKIKRIYYEMFLVQFFFSSHLFSDVETFSHTVQSFAKIIFCIQ